MMDVTVRWFGRELDQTITEAAIRGLNKAGEYLLAKSVEIVPVDTGDLRASGSVHEAFIGELRVLVVFSMGYAAIVHEGTHMNFSRVKNPLAQAKYLEGPLIRERVVLTKIVLAEIRRALQS